MRIGVDARSLLRREPRGEGKTLLRLYEEMLRQTPGLQARFFGDSAALAWRGTVPEGVTVEVIPSWGHRINGWENVSLPWRAWRTGCQVLHCASSGAPAWSPLPLVMTVHDLIPALRLDGQDEAAQAAFLRRLHHGLRQARQVITVSHHTRRDLLTLVPDLKPPVTVVHWGCDPAPPVAMDPPNAPYVITFGGSAPRKNTHYTLERFAAVAAQVPHARLVIVGVGHPKKQKDLQAQADALGIGERVDIPGFLSEEALDIKLRGARALAYLSTYEGFGLPVLEAVVRGVPVVALNCSSLPEIFGLASGCFDLTATTQIEKTLVSLLAVQDFRQALVHEQSVAVSKFRWPAAATLTSTILLEARGG